jgi:ribosomal protein S3AE
VDEINKFVSTELMLLREDISKILSEIKGITDYGRLRCKTEFDKTYVSKEDLHGLVRNIVESISSNNKVKVSTTLKIISYSFNIISRIFPVLIFILFVLGKIPIKM